MDEVDETLGQFPQDDGQRGEMDMETLGRLPEMSILTGMIPRPRVSLDIRRMNKEGLLRDDGAAFIVSWESGDKVLVIANRKAVQLHYSAGGKEESQDILLAWTDDKSWFICSCDRQVTKLHSDGLRFVCRRCLQGPPQPRRRRIPAKQRLRILARAGFQCTGCKSQEGLTVVSGVPPLPGASFLDTLPYYDEELYSVCSFCRLSPNDSVRRVMEVAGRLRSLQSVETSKYARLSTDAPRLNSLQIAEMQHRCAPDTNSPAKTDKSPHKRRKEHGKQTHRVLIRLLLGHSPSEIACDEGLSRSTVWRQRKHLDGVVVLVARDLMRRAARKKDWEEARLWWECLMTVGADIDGEEKASGKEASQVRKLLEAVRDVLLGRTQARREEAA